MGDTYIKIAGVWTKVTRPYVKKADHWVPVKETWVKQGSTYNQSWDYNPNPPSIPEISLEIIDNRYIRIGVRLPDTTHDPLLKRFRVLGGTAMPTTPTGTGSISGSDVLWPNEAWSNWWFNGYGGTSDHVDSHLFTYKRYPLNPTSTTNLPGGRNYYFAAWAEDVDGNYSYGQFSTIWMPKDGNKASNVLVKEASITADAAGSWTGGTYSTGLVKAHNSPLTEGSFFYGSKLNNIIGQSGTPTITSAAIRLTRSNDAGQPSASVRLGWHGVGTPTDAVSGDKTGATWSNIVNLSATQGGIQKGETKWFDLPTSWYTHFNTGIKGIGLKDGPSVSDDIELNDLGTTIRCGEVHVTWEEAL